MGQLNIGGVIQQLRKSKGITQEQLANFLGLSTPAVSKWESGQAYPDITHLPKLASYFKVSIDYLMDYASGLTDEEVEKIYFEYFNRLGKEEFSIILADVKELIRLYDGCGYLKMMMGVLMVNALPYTGEENKSCLELAVELFSDVVETSLRPKLVLYANYMLATCKLKQEKPDEAIEMLEMIRQNQMPTEPLLAEAWRQKGELKEAKKIEQQIVFSSIIGILDACMKISILLEDNPLSAISCLEKALAVQEEFDFQKTFPVAVRGVSLALASLYARIDEDQAALSVMEEYAELFSVENNLPLKLTPQGFFDLLVEVDIPQNEDMIKQALWADVAENEAFKKFRTNPRFEVVLSKLKGRG